MSMEEFSLQVAWPGVHPSSHGGGEASAAQEDDLEATPPESFVPETNPEKDVVIVEASPQASPVSTPVLELRTPTGITSRHTCATFDR